MKADAQQQKAAGSLESFIAENSDRSDPNSRFEKISARMLRIDVSGNVWLNLGTAIAYYGDLKFRRLPTLKTKNLKKLALREIIPFVGAEGKGRLYCAHQGWRLRTVRLSGETLNVAGNELLAFEDSLDFEIFMVGIGVSVTSGGIFGVRLSGEGSLAIAVHGDPLVLPVSSDEPLFTDPHATIAWTEGLTPTLKTDLTWHTWFAHGGGESFQMQFGGDGYVVVQPSQDPAKLSWKKLKKLL
jgi:uncharacterized protein (AIM24 family)